MAGINNRLVMGDLRVLLLFLCIFIRIGNTAVPTGCSEDKTDSSVTHNLCDFSLNGGSISFSGFTDSQPQRLTVYKVSGSISSAYFNGFSSFDTSTLNNDYPATLQVNCISSTTFAAGTFTNMGYMQEVFINDCETSLIASMFNGLGTVNKLSIKGGTLSTIDVSALSSLDIAPISAVEQPRGELRIENVVLTPGTFPANFFSPITNVKVIYLEHLGLTTVDAAWFQSNTALVYLSLANNQITTLPATVFDTTLGLLYINLEGDPLDCTDSGTAWYYNYAIANNITFSGSAVCNTPATEQYKSLHVWSSQFAKSTDACNGEMGIVVSGNCIGLFQLICYSVTFVCLVFGLVSLILVIYLRRSTLRAKQENLNRGKPSKANGKSSGKRKESNAWT